MTFQLSQRSRDRLVGVHPDLVRVVERTIDITDLDFGVLEGVRSIERQKKLFDAGASHTMDSRHLTGHAVDLAVYLDGELHWDWPLYPKLAVFVKAAAAELGIPITWGGDWKFHDGPHFELPWDRYPKAPLVA